jgi:hypothetical protein
MITKAMRKALIIGAALGLGLGTAHAEEGPKFSMKVYGEFADINSMPVYRLRDVNSKPMPQHR